jgi:hypothetical protein
VFFSWFWTQNSSQQDIGIKTGLEIKLADGCFSFLIIKFLDGLVFFGYWINCVNQLCNPKIAFAFIAQ